MPQSVKIDDDGNPRCSHGPQPGAEYKEQDPAPCGDAWVWEDGKLVEVPGRRDAFDGDEWAGFFE